MSNFAIGFPGTPTLINFSYLDYVSAKLPNFLAESFSSNFFNINSSRSNVILLIKDRNTTSVQLTFVAKVSFL